MLSLGEVTTEDSKRPNHAVEHSIVRRWLLEDMSNRSSRWFFISYQLGSHHPVEFAQGFIIVAGHIFPTFA